MRPRSSVYTLLNGDRQPYASPKRGFIGGNRRARIYGTLDCPSALRALAAGGYARHRVFFADQQTAVAAGYRPCAVCMPEAYRIWRHTNDAHQPLVRASPSSRAPSTPT
jgi:methylphosphotriester-DNA--protein-cysteine methyltransferase